MAANVKKGSDRPSARLTAIQAVHNVRASTTGLISADEWEQIINLAWDAYASPIDRAKLHAQLQEVLDRVAANLTNADDPNSGDVK